MFRSAKERKPFDRIARILAEMPFLRSVKPNWRHDESVPTFVADSTADFLSRDIDGDFDKGSWCWVRVLTDLEDDVIKVVLPGYRCTMWDALHHLREQGTPLEHVTHIMTYSEDDGPTASQPYLERRTTVWRVNEPGCFLKMYLSNWRTRQLT